MVEIQFTDIPIISSMDEVRRVHLSAGEYFLKRGGSAHAEMTCGHLDDTKLVENSAWRIATADQVRVLKRGWCESCC